MLLLLKSIKMLTKEEEIERTPPPPPPDVSASVKSCRGDARYAIETCALAAGRLHPSQQQQVALLLLLHPINTVDVYIFMPPPSSPHHRVVYGAFGIAWKRLVTLCNSIGIQQQ